MKNVFIIVFSLIIGGAVGAGALYHVEHQKTTAISQERDTLSKNLGAEKVKVEALSRKPEYQLLSAGEVKGTGEAYALLCKLAVGGEECDVYRKKVNASSTERTNFATLYPLAASTNAVKVLALANNYVLLSESLSEPPHTEVTALRYADGSAVHYSGAVRFPGSSATNDVVLFTIDGTSTLSFSRLSLDGVLLATATAILPPEVIREGFVLGKSCKDADYECLATVIDNGKVITKGKNLSVPVYVHKQSGTAEKTILISAALL